MPRLRACRIDLLKGNEEEKETFKSEILSFDKNSRVVNNKASFVQKRVKIYIRRHFAYFTRKK